MENIHKVQIKTRSKPGASVSEALKELLILAVTEHCDVELTHEDLSFTVRIDYLYRGIGETKC